MISNSRLLALGLNILLSIIVTSPVLSDTADSAPFNDAQTLRRFSDFLITKIAQLELHEAETLAKKNSHVDDKITQQNLDEVFAELRNQLPTGESMQEQFVQQSNFGRSFIRHQYSLKHAQQSTRCMLTYRRKTDGWRLNQLWCS